MSERENEGATVVELMLREPEIVAWLGEREPEPREQEPEWDDEPPRAA